MKLSPVKVGDYVLYDGDVCYVYSVGPMWTGLERRDDGISWEVNETEFQKVPRPKKARNITISRRELNHAVANYVEQKYGVTAPKFKITINSRIHRKVYDDKKVVRVTGATFAVGA